jgi:hypothetical protein
MFSSFGFEFFFRPESARLAVLGGMASGRAWRGGTMKKKTYCHFAGVLVVGAGAWMLASCSARAGEDTTIDGVDTRTLAIEETETRGVESQGGVTSCNADGCWTAKALRPVAPSAFAASYRVYGRASFVGPEGHRRRMGVCLLQQYVPATACTTVADCANAPTVLPPGGFRYCAAPGHGDDKSCFYRPGSPPNFCAGTPADPDRNPIAPGIYKTPAWTTSSSATWISYACFEGCAVVEPSVSRPRTVKGPLLDD